MSNAPGTRFSRIGDSTTPRSLLDTWLMVDPVEFSKYIRQPAAYLAFQKAVDKIFGAATPFVFIGELDPRDDLGIGHRLAEILQNLGVDILHPAASSMELGVSMHVVARWPGYCILLHGWASGRADWARMKAYVMC